MKSFLLVLFLTFLFQNQSIADGVNNNNTQQTEQEKGVLVISHGSTTIKRNVVKENAQKTIEQEKQRQIVKQQNEERKKQQKVIEKQQKQDELEKQQIAENVVQFANQPLITGLEDKEQTSMFTDILDVIKVVMDAYKDLYNDNIKQGATPAHPSITGAYAKMYNILDKFHQFVHKDDKNKK